MKRTLIGLILVPIALGILGAITPLPGEIRDLLLRSFVREREVVARYEQFARKADEEGYRGAAALFRAQMQAERTHAERFASLLHEHGIPIPPEASLTSNVGSTRENLNAAAAAERGESDTDYHDAVETCSARGRSDIAEIFDQTRDSEVEHANLCAAAARDLDAMRATKMFYVCVKCGYTTDAKLPFCPACQHKRALAAVE